MILLCVYVYNRFYLKKKANAKLEELNFTITNRNLEFKKLNKELELANKEKDKLFSIISHELRNPLYWLQNLAEVLSRKHTTMSEDKVKKTLLSMDESAKNVYHLMDNLLHWSRNKLNRVHPKKLRHNLYTLIADTTRMYETFLKQKEINFTLDIPKDIYIHADADLFACVIRNLVSNAIKYTPQGGKIGFRQELSAHYVTLVLIDSGKGMTDLQLKSVFDFSDSNLSMPGLMQEKGSGLGLKLCRDFVEMNDGKLWADSISGIGTRFFFTVPLQNPVRIKLEELEISENMN
jgi:signal transduction histidine kinase